MRQRLRLNSGETLFEENHRSKGTLAETDIWTYAVLDTSGVKIGTVVHTDHTAINGFSRTQSVVQTDRQGNTILNDTW